MAVQTPSFFSFNGPETLFSNNNSVTSTPAPVNIPTNLGGGSQYGSSNVWNPGVGNDPVVTSPTNVGNPFGYGMSNTIAQGTMPSGDDRSAYEKAMADRYASTVVSPGLFGTDIGKQTGYTGQGNAGGRSPSLANSSNAGGAPSGGGGGYSGAATQQASTAQPLRPQDLSQRALSGSYYAPDLSAYNDSSLFNYTGPGGVDEYTYGQGLPIDGAGYNVWGTPADMVNPYYEGQFAQAPTGVADSAINMSPVVTPDGIPDVSKPTTFPNFMPIPPRPGDSAADLNYAQQIEAMGLTTQTAPSTLFDNTGFVSSNTPSLFDRQLEQMGPERIAAMNATLADQERMQQGQISDPIRTTFDTPAGSAPAAGTANPQGGMPVPEFNNIQSQGLSPMQQAIRDAADTKDTRDFRFNPTGEQDKGLFQKWVENGPAYQPADDDTIAEMEAMGNQVKSFADKASMIRNMGAEPDNLFDNHFDRNQAEYTPTLSDYYPGATPMQLAGNSTLGATKDGVKTGPSGTTAIDANNKNLDKMIEQNNLPWRDRKNTSLFSSPNLIDIALRYASGGDVTQNAITAHRSNKEGDYGDGLKSYKDENLQKLDGSLYQPVSDATDGYHFRSGKDAGNLSGSQDLNLGGLPMAAGSWLYQQANGLLDGTVGSNANKQSIDNMQGLIASGNAPALKSLFDNYEAGKVRETKMNESIADGTFKPGVKAPVEAARKAEAAKSAREKAAKAKVKSETLAKAKAAQVRSKAAAKAKSDAAAKAKSEAAAKAKAAEARAKAAEARRNPPPKPKKVKTTPRPTQKNVISKPKPKPGGLAGAGAATKSYKTFARNYGGRYGL